MPTHFVKRQASLAPNETSRPNANPIFVDSDNDSLTWGSGATGTSVLIGVDTTQAQTISGAKTMSSLIVNSGAAVGATGPEIDNVADVSARLVAAGATLTLTAATHSGRTILLNTAAGSAITLPAATASGAVFTFISSVTPTSNQHRIRVVGNDEFVGVLHMSQDDAGSLSIAFRADDAGDNDSIDMNGTTTGGRIGDTLTLVDISTDNWHVSGTLKGSGVEATPFVTAQVT